MDTASNGDADDAGDGPRRRPMDPPEELFERAPRRPRPRHPPPPSRGHPGGDDDDDRVDEFEMEGLLVAPAGAGAGAGAGRRAADVGGLVVGGGVRRALAPPPAILAGACSVAWSPRHRARSAVGALLLVVVVVVLIAVNDDIGGAPSVRGRREKPGGGRRDRDPLSALTPGQRASLLERVYGSWTFYDGSAEDRPTEPYLTAEKAGNPYLDLAEADFPVASWQADAVYANHFLDAATKLVRRGQRAIFAAYRGHGLSNVRVVATEGGDGGADEEVVEYEEEDADARITQRMTMFRLEEVDLSAATSAEELEAAAPTWRTTGGWTTARSFDGLGRRLIHAITTESDFVVVVAGGWRSMGYGGNHAWQGMAGVFEALLKGLFDKMGVNLVVRAIGLPPLLDLDEEDLAAVSSGGKSTLAHALGWSSIYGSDVDMVVWDDYGVSDDGESAGKLDELSAQLFDLFARQALLSGNTSLPFIWGGDFDVLRNLHEHADVDVGQLGNGLVGVQETTSEKAARDLPWAAQYVNCPAKMQNACQKEEYRFESKCWIDRTDVTPPTPQLDHIPVIDTALGWRMHKLKGYTLAYIFLQATLDALNKWSEITISQGFPLLDEYWHMGDYIQNVQGKVKALDEAAAPHCFQLQEKANLPKRLCKNRLQGRTEFTPRANPAETSLRTLLDPPQVPKATPQPLYEGDDVPNPLREVPAGEVDVLEILELQGKKRRRRGLLGARNATGVRGAESDNDVTARRPRRTLALEKGEGWQLLHGFGDGCDGSLSSSSTCGRLASSDCLMEGHQGSRGGLWGNETTGWLFFHHITAGSGFIALNLELGGRELTAKRRALDDSLPDSFVLEYTVDVITGFDEAKQNADRTIKTLAKKDLLEKMQHPVPGVSLLIVHDDIESSETKNMVVGVRSTGCADEIECQFAVTHVYWS